MYKLIVVNNKFRLFGKKETITAYETTEELLVAVEKVEKDNKSFYITDENNTIIDIDEIRGHIPLEEVYTKTLDLEYDGIKLKIVLTENKFTHEIKSKLSVLDKEKLYVLCMTDHKLFSKLELYNYFKRHLKELKDLELAYMIMSLIFNQ